MTKIVQSHLLAHRGILAVSHILEQAGALSETIQNDYGEDLLVQTHLNESADNFHVFIQVKSTTRKTKTGPSIRVSVDHLRRWVLSSQQFVICAYDVDSGITYAKRPSSLFSIWSLALNRNKSITINFSGEDILSPDVMKNIIWQCRIEYFSKIISNYENKLYYYGPNSKIDKTSERDLNYIVFYFLQTIGIIEDDKINEEFRARFHNVAKNFVHDHKGEKWIFRGAMMLCLVDVVNRLAKHGIPINLMELGTDMCGHFFSNFHPEEWKAAEKLFAPASWKLHNARRRKPPIKTNGEEPKH